MSNALSLNGVRSATTIRRRCFFFVSFNTEHDMTYSRDFRLLAVRLYKQFGTYRRVSGLLNVSVSTVHRWTTKGVDGAEAPRRRPPRVVLQEIEQCILAHIERYPFSTIRDVAAGVLAEKKVRLGFKTLSKCMKRLGISRKKAYHKTPVPTDDHKEKAFKAQMRDVSATHDVKIASIDECYFSEKVLPNFGYCLRGRRLQPCTRKGSWKKRSLLLSVHNDGTFKYKIVRGSIDTTSFSEFVTQLRQKTPSLSMMLDNVSFHHSACRQLNLVDRCVFTPPYRPEFNPVEYCFSKIKSRFRKDWAHACMEGTRVDTFDQCLERAINSLQPEDIVGCFDHVSKLVAS